jgi:MYXO-CTERM domain-containing protein
MLRNAAQFACIGCCRLYSTLQTVFANGAMAHCLDFDDRTPWEAHSSSSAVPAAFALAALGRRTAWRRQTEEGPASQVWPKFPECQNKQTA